MKVAIFETEHFEAGYSLIRLFNNGQNEITVFSYAASKRQFDYLFKDDQSKISWVTKKEHQSKASFIYTIYQETKKRKIDLLYLNTVSDNFLFYAMLAGSLPKIRIVLTLHMVYNFFSTRSLFNPRRMIRAIGKKMLRRAIKEFNVLSPTLLPLLQKKFPAGKKIHQVPGAIFEKNAAAIAEPSPGLFTIVIPGSIDNKRRDYDQVFKLLNLLKQEDIAAEIVLLGSFYGEYGQTILAQCREWAKDHANLRWYEEGVVDQPEFDRVMKMSHFIFTPTVIDTIIADGIEEFYGISISSGNIADAIRHARPLIIPGGLVVDPVLEKGCVRYSGLGDIVSLLKSIRNDQSVYMKLANAAIDNSQQFTIEKVRMRNTSLFTDI